MYLRQTAQHEELERQRIELRRRQHHERLLRIMDEKQRERGNDYVTIAQQIEEKKARQAAEAAEQRDYERRFLEEQRLLGRLANEERKIRRQIAQEDDEFRRTKQAPELCREYDIWRPDYKRVQPPVRASDNDPWLSVSGCQKMEGEDLTGDDRRRRQREQLDRWAREQMAEKENRDAQERADQREWERRYLENDRLMCEIEERQQMARREVRERMNEENNRAANEKRRRDAEEKQDQWDMDRSEIEATTRGPFMSESRSQAIGHDGRRVVQDWKGMSDEEKLQVIEERRNQLMENQRRRAEEAARERREEMERQRAARDAMRRERAEMREKQQRAKELADQYLKDAEEEKERERRRNKEIYGENQPTEDFWNYFGRSHR